MEEGIDFGLEPVTPSIIMVAGVGGGGSNAVNHMFEQGIAQVTFMICNTDRQALRSSPVPNKIKLGEKLTEGMGAGNIPGRGRDAALESLDEIMAAFKREGTRMVFITAGMGGGTGTGAAPVIAKAAKESGILTVGIVTLPFRAEGKIRAMNAAEGIEEMRGNVDALLIINNENIQEIYGKLPLKEAFGKADDILASAARGIAEIITREGIINVDFADVSTVMRGSGIALMGSGRASGEERAQKVADMSMASPLLNHNSIIGAKNILLNISYGDKEITMDEAYGIVEYIQERSGNGANIIWGAGHNPILGDDIEVTIIATGFDMDETEVWKGGAAERPARTFVPANPAPPQPCGPGEQAEGETGQTPVQPMRQRWQPPAEPESPFKPRQATAAPAATPARQETAQQEETPQRTQFSPSGRTIEVKADDTYDNIKEITEIPAFLRRKTKFVTQAPPKASRSVIKDDQQEESGKPAEGSLFD